MTEEKKTDWTVNSGEVEYHLPEAPASVNFKGVTKHGWNCQWTLRDFDEDALLDRQGKFIQRLIDGGVQPYPVKVEASVSPNTAELPPMDLPFAETPSPPVQTQEDLFFEAAELLHRSGKAWKIKGGKFTEYGVTIWPEVLEAAGIMPEELDTSKTYPLTGYTAYYEEITEKGYPKKVSRLAKQ